MRKTGIYAGLGYPGFSLDERLRLIRDTGFDTVCLNFEKDMEETETDWENQVKLAEKYNLPVQAVHLTGAGMTDIWTDGVRADALVQRTVDELRRMKSLGINTGVIHVTWGFELPAPPSEAALNRFRKISEEAEKCGAEIALENSVFPGHLHFLLGNLDSPNVGFCYDSGHENAFTPGENFLRDYGNRLFAVHLHDNDGRDDNHYVPFDPKGTIDWGSKVSLMKNTEFFGNYVILEPGPQKCGIRQLIRKAYDAAVLLSEMIQSER